jgi:hypothetical protein
MVFGMRTVDRLSLGKIMKTLSVHPEDVDEIEWDEDD